MTKEYALIIRVREDEDGLAYVRCDDYSKYYNFPKDVDDYNSLQKLLADTCEVIRKAIVHWKDQQLEEAEKVSSYEH